MPAVMEQISPSDVASIEAAIEEVNKPAQETIAEQGPTAKEMAAAEEQNAARRKALIERQQRMAEAGVVDDVPLVSVAAQGMDALHPAIQARSNIPVEPYIPPPRTERQMTQLEAELAAGRRAQQRAQAQQDIANEARARAAAEEAAKNGFTTPVYRPNDVVPDPTIPATGGVVAGTRQFGA